MKVKEITESIGSSLGCPGKMPGPSYGLSALDCITGSKLRAIPGSVCEGCYAMHGNYQTRSVRVAHERRLIAIVGDSWVDGMAAAIERTGDVWFRWHDSGDLQSELHLGRIVEIARRLPGVQFWLPTKEPAMVGRWLLGGNSIPSNLTIRVSMPMRGQEPKIARALVANGVLTSTVDSGVGFVCPAVHGEHRCDAHDCRACWDTSVPNIDYPHHR